jgi:hypothetical protein
MLQNAEAIDEVKPEGFISANRRWWQAVKVCKLAVEG